MKKMDLSKLPVPGKKAKDPMMDLDAAIQEMSSEKGDIDMNAHEDMESPDYETKEEDAMAAAEKPADLSSISDEDLIKELKKRKLSGV